MVLTKSFYFLYFSLMVHSVPSILKKLLICIPKVIVSLVKALFCFQLPKAILVQRKQRSLRGINSSQNAKSGPTMSIFSVYFVPPFFY